MLAVNKIVAKSPIVAKITTGMKSELLVNRCFIRLSYRTKLILQAFSKNARKSCSAFAPFSVALTASLVKA
jgi:hypothetical protein